ncbi:hypothetical protein ANOM_006289 [Aspergillus nomiae NRRL 13137]|uniref:Uncharacterized protein n=1 Tax=Aspergillus nomiae NRRL (strain ATCC 15546 / NRRL 13137 / CBS 260.88 / M93) TaxID=1509407 RepID=A0A0L1J0Q6_ASPN3|nr:uncharacterized protein ANOM_006289 [Aspergillus nomiae NRRL 13137]KNG85337.1 hypothetical protein ANOM_006289 [Aspergillus nomiae NRRL 13137]
MPTLLEVLTRRNPDFVERLPNGGSLTTNHMYPTVNGKEDWVDFSYQNLLQMFPILTAELAEDIPEPSDPEGAEKEDWGEDSTKAFFQRTMFVAINAALKQSWKSLHNSSDPPQIVTGDKAKSTNQTDDSRYSPDLAVVRTSRKQFLSSKYENLIPGDVKEATKWNAEIEEYERDKYDQVFGQMQQYCEQTQQRYAFVITGRELVVIHCRVEDIGSGIAANRTRREPKTPPRKSHMRNLSDVTDLSPLSSRVDRMSISGTSYRDDRSRVDFAPLQRVHVPYSAYGSGKLTFRLALWAICMLAATPGNSTHLQAEYVYPLHSVIQTQRGFLHLSTGAVTQQVPEGAQLVEAPQDLAIAKNDSFLAEHVRAAERHPSEPGLVVTLKDATLPRYIVRDGNRFWSRAKQRWYHLVRAENGTAIWEEFESRS